MFRNDLIDRPTESLYQAAAEPFFVGLGLRRSFLRDLYILSCISSHQDRSIQLSMPESLIFCRLDY